MCVTTAAHIRGHPGGQQFVDGSNVELEDFLVGLDITDLGAAGYLLASEV